MPFREIDIDQVIESRRKSDPEFRETWDSSRTEYRILGQLIKFRKKKGMSQAQLAKITGHKQQVVSRIEKRESSPTLKTLCSLADALDMDILFVPKAKTENAEAVMW